ncbi:hypothetical protein K469DRAFT_721540 [Zopfia rhizophila CBS 207.26]|uniref:Uncharacterized protein n=1 Tax=Zopfia rhizophila CBS 207.26 TaxID=1314779 RepID=A0A6A6EKK0_9PEZI|nr:hypothetical protein K469DRAFT_721540 [Zopfia rhizophila CBS 207.26]
MPPQQNPHFLTSILNPAPSSSHPQPSSSASTTQRRNKPPTTISLSSSQTQQPETHESRQKRENAAQILESMETLIWYSNMRNESLSQTRRHFQYIVWGIEEEEGDVAWREEWEVPVGDRVKDGNEAASSSSDGSGKSKDKGKRRS